MKGLLAVLSLSFSLGALGCDPALSIPVSKLAAGQPYASGQPKFDAFFQEVIDARNKMQDADGEAPLRRTLAGGLGVSPDATGDQVVAAAKDKAQELKISGGAIRVQLSPETKVLGRDGKVRSGDLAKSVGDTLKQGIQSSDDLKAFSTQVQTVAAKLPDMEHDVDATFPDPQKNREVRRELDASRDVLDKARLRALAESGRALGFVVAVARAVDTEGSENLAVVEPPTKPKPTPGKFTGKPPAGGTRPPAGKPHPHEDFDP